MPDIELYSGLLFSSKQMMGHIDVQISGEWIYLKHRCTSAHHDYFLSFGRYRDNNDSVMLIQINLISFRDVLSKKSFTYNRD